MRIFRFFEGLLEPTAVPAGTAPPAGLAAFYWHYARQARHLVAALFVTGFIVALLDTTIPVFIGRVVTLVSGHKPGSLLHDNWPQLVAMALVLLVARPAALTLQNLITNQGIIPSFSNLIRWQSHWHVVRQSWAFFQNDFAGRIAQRVMQTGPSLRESVVSATNAVWYILVYGGGAITLMASNDLSLAIPVVVWFGGYAALLRYFVPRLRVRSRRMSETTERAITEPSRCAAMLSPAPRRPSTPTVIPISTISARSLCGIATLNMRRSRSAMGTNVADSRSPRPTATAI